MQCQTDKEETNEPSGIEGRCTLRVLNAVKYTCDSFSSVAS